MNRKDIKVAIMIGVIALGLNSCGNNGGGNDRNAAEDAVAGLVTEEPCDISFAGIHFTKSINGADKLVSVKGDTLHFSVGGMKDFFNNPNGEILSNAPILISEVDNTKPFTLTAKVTPNFTKNGKYNAGVLYLYSDLHLYQKFCFEQDERGNHRIVTVRTQGTSDDNNHDIVVSPSVYMKISSDTQTLAFYYSLDKLNWQLVRLYRNNYPESIGLGLSAQCPAEDGSFALFEDVSLTTANVSDFRMGD